MPTGGADGLVTVGGIETHAALCQGVDVRRFRGRVPIATEGWLQVINRDEEDVRLRVGGHQVVGEEQKRDPEQAGNNKTFAVRKEHWLFGQ